MTSTLLPDRGFALDRGDPATEAWIAAGLRRVLRDELLAAARRRLSHLLQQSEVPVGRFPATTMNGLLDAIVGDDQPTPQLFPDGHLGLTCEWLVDGTHLLLTVERDGHCYWWSDAVAGRPELEAEHDIDEARARDLAHEFAQRLSSLGPRITRRHPRAATA